MSALVQLHRDAHDGEPLLEAPPWVRPAKYGLYWHQPRSAHYRDDGRITVTFWCGPFRVVESLDELTWLAPSELRCGTCIGRRLGFDGAEGAVFRPRDHWALPTWCPGEGGPGWPSYCVLCGARVRASSRAWMYGEASHRPAPALAERWAPCPRHGWSRMCLGGPARQLVCGGHRCEYVAEALS